MSKSLTISSEKSGFPEYLDWQQLRSSGIKHISDLSGKIWTDHNVHDPGITILEMLCYALTDLGYRTNFDIQELLAKKDTGSPEDNFFTAAEILGNLPLTQLDYRKLLIDIDGVRNAWLERVLETPTDHNGAYLVADLAAGRLKIIAAKDIRGDMQQKININGFYRIYLELEQMRPVVNRNTGTKAVTRESVLHQVVQTLNENRNLGEDFLEIIVLDDEKIGICADMELIADADPTAVLQDIFSRVQDFLSPSIPFYTLSEMLDKKKTPEQIFEGRPLCRKSHGFIDTESLMQMKQRTQLNASDLYQEILKDPRIKAIRNLTLSSSWKSPDGGEVTQKGKEWVLELHPERHRAVLSPDHCSIKFFKNLLTMRVDEKRAKTVFENRLFNFKKALLPDAELDIAIPSAAFRDLEDYHSVQHDFPLVYGIGEGDLGADSPVKRKAQAKQLQAYLTFFDQLLANYLAQLGNLRKLFSFRLSGPQNATYFSQPLRDTPMGPDLIRYFSTGPGRKYIPDPAILYEDRERIADSSTGPFPSPEERDERVRQIIRAFQNRKVKTFVPEEGVISGKNYVLGPWVIKSQADEDLLTGKRWFTAPITAPDNAAAVLAARNAARSEAIAEVEALMMMKISHQHFFNTYQDVLLNENGDYKHEHSFELIYYPADYFSLLQTLAEDQPTYQHRRNHFLNHLLARFAEQFTEYTLLMYALDKEGGAEPEIIKDKETFLQNYPLISRNRGSGFDYSAGFPTDSCLPLPFGMLEGEPRVNICQPKGTEVKGTCFFQLARQTDHQPVFVSCRRDYTFDAAEAEAERIISHFRQDQPSEEYQLRSRISEDQTRNCLVIVRRTECTLVLSQENEQGELLKNETIEEIVAIYTASFPLENSRKARVNNAIDAKMEEILAFFRNDQMAARTKNGDNTSGLERRVAALMGLETWQRRDLGFLKQELETEKVYGFRIALTGQNGKVLLESRQQSYTESKAAEKANEILMRLQGDWENPHYRLVHLPDYTPTEYVLGIGIVKDPNGKKLLMAVHPNTFGTEAERKIHFEQIKEAIINRQVTVEIFKAEQIPFIDLFNEEGEKILTGLISLRDLEAIGQAVEDSGGELNLEILLREKANGFLRKIGQKEVESLFFVDPFHKEYYDFHLVNPSFHVASHPRIYQHKSLREKARDEMFNNYLNTPPQNLAMTEVSWESGASDPQSPPPVVVWSVRVKAPLAGGGPAVEFLESAHPLSVSIDINRFIKSYAEDINMASRDKNIFKVEQDVGGSGKFAVYLQVENNSSDRDKLYFRLPGLFNTRAEAVTRVNEIANRPPGPVGISLQASNIGEPERKRLHLLDMNPPGGERKDFLHSLEYYTSEQSEDLFNRYYFQVMEAAREFDYYTIEWDDDSDAYVVYLNVPEGPSGDPLRFRYPAGFSSQVKAEKKAEYVRQRARLFPVARRENDFIFFMYPNEPLSDFGKERERVDHSRIWNLEWEDRIMWESLTTFKTIGETLLAYRGPLDENGEIDIRPLLPNGNPPENPSFLERLLDKRNYWRTENQDNKGDRDDIGPFNLEIIDPAQVVAVTPPKALNDLENLDFVTSETLEDVGFYRLVRDRKEAFDEVMQFLNREGFHVVEHILLSPKIKAENPAGVQGIYRNKTGNTLELDKALINSMQICPAPDPLELPLTPDTYIPLADPFSSWVTVVLPFWPVRFQNTSFREFFESTIRKETPAHIALRILWVDPRDMEIFETVYRNWLKALYLQSESLMDRRNELVEALFSLTNVYPGESLLLGSESDTEAENIVLDFSKLL